MSPKKNPTPRKPRAAKPPAEDVPASPKKPAAPRKRKNAATPQPPAAEEPASPGEPWVESSGERLEAFIDYPQEDELVPLGQYTFRVGTQPAASLVEAAVDGGEWRRCREAGGYWWYDWRDYETGPHRLVVRASIDGGETVQAERTFTVANGERR